MGAFIRCGPFSATDGEGRRLFEGVSLALDDGQLVSLEGPSGGGKSTLLRHVCGLAWSPDARRRLGGAEHGTAAMPAWRALVTLAAQDAPMLAGSVRDNLAFCFAQKAGRGRAFPESDALRLLAAVGLQMPLDREVRTVSGGERHRIALVRGLLWDPPVLLVDEPLSGLDPGSAETCFRLLQDFARRPGRLVLGVFHDPEHTRRADRRLRLSDGRVEAA